MPETPDDITRLLREAQVSDPAVAEFAWVWLEAFRRDAADVLRLQRQEGRAEAVHGGDVDAVRRRAEERLEGARRRLLGRLQRLLAWAEQSGRAGQEP